MNMNRKFSLEIVITMEADDPMADQLYFIRGSYVSSSTVDTWRIYWHAFKKQGRRGTGFQYC